MVIPNIEKVSVFHESLLAWFEKCGRQLPWREGRTPFQIMIAEILLQQTNAKKVWPVYETLIERYPHVESLANSSIADIADYIHPLGLVYRGVRIFEIIQSLQAD